MDLKERLVREFKTIDWSNVLMGVARPIFLPIVLCTVLSYLGSFHQIFELTTHYRLQYFLGALFTLCLYAFSKRRVEILICLFCVGLNAIDILPWYLPKFQSQTTGTPLRVMVSNVLTSNKRYDDFLTTVKQENPAILVTMEINDLWQERLKPLKAAYPYFLEMPNSDNFGIALYSQVPLEEAKVQYWAEEAYGVPSITANVRINNQPITVIATHPLPPLKPDYFKYRNRHMVEMAEFVNQLPNSAIVLGDLNMSMWSPYFRQFLKATRMKSSRQGFGVQPSWPADSPFLQIPIDHCLVSPKIQVKGNHIGPNVGSDHYPLIADLAIE
jgi:endonuclease/exonuclease/phosphatase (EEP) superfamily protein YafD